MRITMKRTRLLSASIGAVLFTGVVLADAPLAGRSGAMPAPADQRNLVEWTAQMRRSPGHDATESVRPSWKPGPTATDTIVESLEAVTPAETTLQTPRNLARSFGSAARRGLARVLMQATSLDSWRERQDENRSPASSSSSGSGDDRVRFRVGVSRLTPKVEMSYPMMGGGALGVSVSALGQLNVDLQPTRIAGAQVHAGYDHGSGTFSFLCQVSF